MIPRRLWTPGLALFVLSVWAGEPGGIGIGQQAPGSESVQVGRQIYCDLDDQPSGDSREAAMQGSFVTQDQPGRMVLAGSRTACVLRLPGFAPLSFHKLWVTFDGVCRDPVTGLDHAILFMYSGGASDPRRVVYVYADHDARKLRVGFSEYNPGDSFGYSSAQPTPDGMCRWRTKDEAVRVFSRAVSALKVGDETPKEDVLAVAPGTTVRLPYRRLFAETVADWLAVLAELPLDVADIDAMVSRNGRWTVVQIAGMVLYEGPGVVLLYDAKDDLWRSIYDSESRTRSHVYGPDIGPIENDGMYADLCRHCTYGYSEFHFRIDLSSLQATSLSWDGGVRAEEEFSWTEDRTLLRHWMVYVLQSFPGRKPSPAVLTLDKSVKIGRIRAYLSE